MPPKASDPPAAGTPPAPSPGGTPRQPEIDPDLMNGPAETRSQPQWATNGKPPSPARPGAPPTSTPAPAPAPAAAPAQPPSGASTSAAREAEGEDELEQENQFVFPEPGTMGITESIASAPDPRPGDFVPPRMEEDGGIDLEALERQVDDDMPGSPTGKLMRAIAPPHATQPNPQWPAPPPNASVNLFIGRALLSNGNDNWPLKPNDIVSWIRKHYPSEWDGDEGRCSAHRVRTYLARKGADMYYEKLTQGCIAGWRIRANHLWRFENGGFQGRGMKQEEAIANAQKESEAIATAARKAAAAEALAAGHPGVKVSMSAPGVSDGAPAPKRPRVKPPVPQVAARKRKSKVGEGLAGALGMGLDEGGHEQFSFDQEIEPQTLYSHLDQATAGPSSHAHVQQQQGHEDASGAGAHVHHDPHALSSNSAIHHLDGTTGDLPDASASASDAATSNAATAGLSLVDGMTNPDGTPVDINIVQQAMQAAAGQIDDLEMGMQLPIEMQMHSNEHDDEVDGFGGGQHGYTGHDQNYGYTG
ncbi:hypothetical protein IAT38_002490 [Cryptococcus sp. DSM 104549]